MCESLALEGAHRRWHTTPLESKLSLVQKVQFRCHRATALKAPRLLSLTRQLSRLSGCGVRLNRAAAHRPPPPAHRLLSQAAWVASLPLAPDLRKLLEHLSDPTSAPQRLSHHLRLASASTPATTKCPSSQRTSARRPQPQTQRLPTRLCQGSETGAATTLAGVLERTPWPSSPPFGANLLDTKIQLEAMPRFRQISSKSPGTGLLKTGKESMCGIMLSIDHDHGLARGVSYHYGGSRH